MPPFNFRRWLQGSTPAKKKPVRRERSRYQLNLEAFEDRIAPAGVFSWTGGGGANTNWSNPLNWSGNVAPGGTGGEQLQFNVASTTAVNNIGGTFESITIGASNVTLLGSAGFNSITLTSGITVNANQASDIIGGTTPTTALNISLLGDQTFKVGSSSDLTLNSKFTGFSQLIINGPGVVRLSADNSGFSGPITLPKPAGIGPAVVEITDPNALGTGEVTVEDGSELRVRLATSVGVVSATTLGTTATITTAAAHNFIAGQTVQIAGVNVFGYNGTITVGAVLNPTQFTYLVNGPLANGTGGNVAGGRVNNALNISGSGASSLGSLINSSTVPTMWSGDISLSGLTTLSSSASTSFSISGKIDDPNGAQGIVKEGTGTIILTNANSYRGVTTINDGTLSIRNNLALGAGSADITVNSDSLHSEFGTLNLDSGITVSNRTLHLNGRGASLSGALTSTNGINTWAGNIFFDGGTGNGQTQTIDISTASGSTLIVSGVPSAAAGTPAISGTGANFVNIKGGGTTVFATANTYSATTAVNGGATLEIRDSMALGSATAGDTQVASGSTLKLAGGPTGRIYADSITGTLNSMQIRESLDLLGSGVLVGGSNVGALYSNSGINYHVGSIEISGAIGVDAPASAANPSNPAGFPYNYDITGTGVALDDSLTITGFISSNTIFGSLLSKVGTGQLYLPNSNGGNSGIITSNVQIQQGAVTIGNTDSLGSYSSSASINDQRDYTISSGASLNLLSLANAPQNSQQTVTLANAQQGNFTLTFNGRTTASIPVGSSELDVRNALGLLTANSDYAVTLDSPGPNIYIYTITFQGQFAGKTVAPLIAKSAPGAPAPAGGGLNPGAIIQANSTRAGSSGSINLGNQINVVGAGQTSLYPVSDIPGYDFTGQNAGAIMNLAGTNSLFGRVQLNGTASFGVERIYSSDPGNVNYSPNSFSQLLISGPITEGGTPSGINKVGSQRLILQGSGTYSGDVDIKQGVLLVQNDTALGLGNSKTIVEDGAALELSNTLPVFAGGVQAGLQIINERLVINGAGNTLFGEPAVSVSGPNSPSNIPAVLSNPLVSTDQRWQGPATLNTYAKTYDVVFPSTANFAVTATGAGGTTVSTQSVVIVPPTVGSITGASQSGNTVTITGTGFIFSPGQQVTIRGIGVSAYNGTFTVLPGSSTTSFTYSNANTGLSAWTGTDATVVPVSSFVLNYDGKQETVAWDSNATYLTNNIQAALNALFTTNSVLAANVPTVKAAGPNTYNLFFPLAQTLPITRSNAVGVGVELVQRFTFDGNLASGNTITLRYGAQSASVAWSFNTTTMFNSLQSALGKISAGNAPTVTPSGPAGSYGTLNIPKGNRLTITGNIDDSSVDPNGSDLYVIGTGIGDAASSELNLGGANTYRGTTYFPKGLVAVITNGQALGGSGVAEQQTLTIPTTAILTATTSTNAGITSAQIVTSSAHGYVTGNTIRIIGSSVAGYNGTFAITKIDDFTFTYTVAGPLAAATGGVATNVLSFTLSFNGGTTAPINFTGSASADAAAIQAALNDPAVMTSISPLGGSVSVLGSGPGVFALTLGGTLRGLYQPAFTSSTPGVSAVIATPGGGGTIVADGGALNTKGDITVAGESLVLQGKGVKVISPIPAQWWEMGPAPILGSQLTPNNQNSTGSITSVAYDRNDSTGATYFVTTSDGGVWKTINGGTTWEPLFDYRAIGVAANITAYSQNNTTTMTLTAANTFSAGQQVLLTGMPAGLNGYYLVTGATSTSFTITLGTTSNILTTPITAVATPVASPIFANSIALGPTSGAFPPVIYLGTGEARNAANNFYGSGVYKSLDGGQNWTLLTQAQQTGGPNTAQQTIANSPNPLGYAGTVITKVVPDPTIANVVYVATSSAGYVGNTQPDNPNAGIWKYDGGTSTWTNLTSTTHALTNPTPNVANGVGSNPLNFQRIAGISQVAPVMDITLSGAVPTVASTLSTNGLSVGTSVPFPNLNILRLTFGGNTWLGNSYRITFTVNNTSVQTPFIAWSNDPTTAINNAVAGINATAGLGVTATLGTNVQGQRTTIVTNDPQLFEVGDSLTLNKLNVTGPQYDDPNPLTAPITNPSFTPTFPNPTLPVPFTGNNTIVYTNTRWGLQPSAQGYLFGVDKKIQFQTKGTFTNPGAVYSDLAVLVDPQNPSNRIIAFALGTPYGGQTTNWGFSRRYNNGVYVSVNGGTTFQEGGFPTTLYDAPTNALHPEAGNIKLSLVQVNATTLTLFASMANPTTNLAPNEVPNAFNRTLQMQMNFNPFFPNPTFPSAFGPTNEWTLGALSATPGVTWQTQVGQPNADSFGALAWWPPLPNPRASLLGQQYQAMAVNPNNPTQVALGGSGDGTNFIVQLYNGTTWVNISTDGAGNGPGSGVENLSFQTFNGVTYLLATSAKGIFRYNLTTLSWSTLNTNLSVTQFNGIATNPYDINGALGAVVNNGLVQYTGGQTWNYVGNYSAATGNPPFVSGVQVAYNPNDPTIAYQIAADYQRPNHQWLYRSTNANAAPASIAWTAVLGGFFTDVSSFWVDPVNPNRLLAMHNGTIQESLNAAASFPITLGGSGTFVAGAVYQGNFKNTGAFNIVDQGRNTYVPGTFYTASTGGTVRVSMNYGISYQTYSLPGFSGVATSLTVDPSDMYTAFVTSTAGQVFRTTDGGLNWTDLALNGGLPLGPVNSGSALKSPIWSLSLDSRNGDMFVGTDIGVYRLTQSTIASITNAGLTATVTTTLPHRFVPGQQITVTGFGGGAAGYMGTALVDSVIDETHFTYTVNSGGLPDASGGIVQPMWQAFGAGLPAAQVRALDLNQKTNTLTIGTYGRGAFNVTLDGALAESGALSSLAGSAIWGGTITLAGKTVIGAQGTQNLQNGVASASLNIQGTITDASYHPSYADETAAEVILGTKTAELIKTGYGVVILSGPNKYSGVTEIVQGVVTTNNVNAITGEATIVRDGTALQLQSSLGNEPIFLYGNGIPLNGHNTGALRNLSGNNAYGGTITLMSIATIGVDQNSSLTIGASGGTITDAGNGFSLIKEGKGQLVLAGANTYGSTANGVAGTVSPTLPNGRSYSVGTVVSQGSLIASHSLAFGDNFGSNPAVTTTTVLDGAQLGVQGGIDLLANLNLSGTGANGTGALSNVSGTNFISGDVVMAQNGGFVPVTNPPTAVSIGVAPASGTLTLKGAISQTANADNIFTITFNTPGLQNLSLLNLLNLTGGGTATLTTLVNGSANADAVQSITFSGNITGGSFNIRDNNTGLNTAPIVFPNPYDAELLASRIQTALGNIGDTTLVTYGLGLNKVGAGKLVLTQSVDFTGQTKVTSGILEIAASGDFGTISVSPGAALNLNAPINTNIIVTSDVVLNGKGIAPANAGALVNVSGDNTLVGNIVLQTNAAVGIEGNTKLTATGIKDYNPAPTPPATFTKEGTGTLVVTGANSYGGETYVNRGVLNVRNNLGLGAGAVAQVMTVTVIGSNTGTFTLSFGGRTTSSISLNTLSLAQLLSNIQTQLNALMIADGRGGTMVASNISQFGTVYTFNVTLGGTFLGFNKVTNPDRLTAAGGVGISASAATTVNGSGGTMVSAPGKLELEGGVTIANEPLILNGGQLASAANSNVYASQVALLGSGSVVSAAASSQLSINRAISEITAAANLGVQGPGTVTFSGSTSNTYTGLTTVSGSGTLQLNKTGPALGISGDVRIGTVAGDVSTLLLLADNQIAPSKTITVETDGNFNLNGSDQAIASLTINGGTVTIPNGSDLTLTGNVTANSDANGPASILGGGQLSLGAVDRTFTVLNGADPTDLEVAVLIAGSAGLIKNGPGRLEFDAIANIFSGATTVNNGDVQVNAGTTLGPVILASAAASLSGGGSVATLNGGGTSPVNPAVGTVAPGSNDTAFSRGTLTIKDSPKWGPATTLSVHLDISDNDKIIIETAGLVDLGSAVLTGFSGAGVAIGQSFTILEVTGGGSIDPNSVLYRNINGVLSPIQRTANPNDPARTVFIGGQKYTVEYTADNKSIVLTRALAVLQTFTLSANPTSSVYGQDVEITATVVPEDGATLPVDAQVTFILDASTSNTVTVTVPVVNGVAKFRPQSPPSQSGFTFDAGSTHTIDAAFHDNSANPVFADANATQYQLTVAKNSVNIAASSSPAASPTSPAFGVPLTIHADVTAVVAPTTANSQLPGGNVFFTIDADPTIYSVPINSSGRASFIVPANLSVGVHTIHILYNTNEQDINYAKTTTPVDFSITVQKDAVGLSITPAVPSWVTPALTPRLGDQVDFAIQVSPAASGSTGIPGGTVEIYDGTVLTAPNLKATGSLDGTGQATLSINSLSVGTHTLTLRYVGNGSYQAKTTTLTYTIGQGLTTTTLAPQTTTINFGQAFTLQANVAPQNGGTGNPSGSVTFWLGATSVGAGGTNLGTASVNSSTGAAFLNPSNIPVGTHTIYAIYSGESRFETSTGSTSYTISPAATAVSVGAVPTSSTFGANVTFTATITSGALVPNAVGNVTFVDVTTNTTLGTVALDAQGKASLTVSTLSVGTHQIQANYSGGGNFAAGNGTLNSFVVNKATSQVQVTATPSSGLQYGQSLDITATISASNPGASTGSPLNGTIVTFYDGSVATGVVLGTGTVTNGVATLSGVTNLSVGAHTLTVAFPGDDNFNASTGTLANFAVGKAGTSINVQVSGTQTYGNTLSFQTTVSTPNVGAGTPMGSIVILDQSTNTVVGSGTLTNGTITIQSSTIPVGTRTLLISFAGNSNFANSTTTIPNFVVTPASTTVSSVTPSVSASGPGQSVTFTAVIAATNSSATPTGGTVTFRDGVTVLGTVNLVNGQALFTTSTLAGGAHSITATYNGTTNFTASAQSSSLTFNVLRASTTNLSSSPASALYGQSVTLNASVSGTGGTPTGDVTFYNGAVNPANLIGTVSLAGGAASLPLGSLPNVGTYTITAVYSGDADFVTSTKTYSLTIGKATTSLSIAPSGAQIYGNQISFLVTALATSSGSPGTPTGSVTLVNTTTNTTIGTATLSGGQVTIDTSSLGAGTFNFQATLTGSGNYANSTQTLTGFTITRASTTVAAPTSSAPSVSSGQPVTFTAQVTATDSPAAVNAGTVTFYANNIAFGTGTVNSSGLASLTTSSLAEGSYTITATYATSANFSASAVSTGTSQLVLRATNISTIFTPANPTFGQSVSMQITVAPSTGSGTPTGTVQVFSGNTLLGTQTLNGSGVANVALGQLNAGTANLSVVYSGDATFGSRTSTTSVTVNQVSTSIAMASSFVNSPWSRSQFGQTVILQATVSALNGPAVTTGVVTFFANGTQIGTATLSGSNVATLPINSLAAGKWHSITASYSSSTAGNNYAASATAQQGWQYVDYATSSVSVNASPAGSSVYGQAVTISATVASGAPGGAAPTVGWVQFYDGNTFLGWVQLNNSNVATYTTTANQLAAGSRNLWAQFGYSPNFYGSAWASTPYTVAKVTPNVAISFPIGTSVLGQPATLVADVTTTVGQAIRGGNTSWVYFYDNATNTNLGWAWVQANGKATLTTSALPLGSRTIRAVFGSSDGSINAASNTLAGYIVTATGTSTQVSSTPGTWVVGQQVTFTAQVTASNGQTPVGSVTFTDTVTNANLGTVNLTSGQASIQTTFTAGNHAIRADFTPTNSVNFPASTFTTPTQNVRNASVVSLQANPTSGSASDAVTLNVSVTGTAGTPAGTVALYDGGSLIATLNLLNGLASYTTTFALGLHNISAVYAGNGTYNGGTSNVASVNITSGPRV